MVTRDMLPPFVEDSDTSLAAAMSMIAEAVNLRGDVFRYIKLRGDEGATCWEIEAALVLRHQTASARIRELYLASAIVDSRERRRTGSGRTAVVWRAVQPPLAAVSA